MNQLQEDFYQVMTRLRANSRAASTPTQEPREWSLDKNGVIVSKPIPIEHSAASTGAINKIVTKYDMSGPTNPNHVYKCGTHDYETKSLSEFNQHIESHNRKAASVQSINKVKAIHDFMMSNRLV